jgi:hypothetical protein
MFGNAFVRGTRRQRVRVSRAMMTTRMMRCKLSKIENSHASVSCAQRKWHKWEKNKPPKYSIVIKYVLQLRQKRALSWSVV